MLKKRKKKANLILRLFFLIRSMKIYKIYISGGEKNIIKIRQFFVMNLHTEREREDFFPVKKILCFRAIFYNG